MRIRGETAGMRMGRNRGRAAIAIALRDWKRSWPGKESRFWTNFEALNGRKLNAWLEV
jgi:hypothetical protein